MTVINWLPRASLALPIFTKDSHLNADDLGWFDFLSKSLGTRPAAGEPPENFQKNDSGRGFEAAGPVRYNLRAGMIR